MAHESTLEAQAGRSPETVDRLMVGVCGAIWLVLLAASVFATVALVRLGTGGGGERQSSWLLYSIIVVSALVILGAIPLLLRARRSALTPDTRADTRDEASAESPAALPVRTPEAPTEKMRVFGVDPYASRELEAGSSAARHAYHAMVDRVWLRGTTSLLGVMGLSLTAVAVGTHLLAGATDTGAWVAFGAAGALAISMVAVLTYFQRQLGEVVATGE